MSTDTTVVPRESSYYKELATVPRLEVTLTGQFPSPTGYRHQSNSQQAPYQAQLALILMQICFFKVPASSRLMATD